MHKELIIESSLEKGDFRKLTYWNMFRKNRAVPLIFGGFFVAGLILFLLSGDNIQLRVGSLFALASPLIAIIMIEFNIFTVNRRGNIEARTYARYTFSDVGIRADADYLEDPLIYNWRNIEGAYENGTFYIVFVNRIQTITIRKTDISSEQKKELLRYLNENVSKEKNHLNDK